MTYQTSIQNMLSSHTNLLDNISREQTIQNCLAHGEAIATANGALATWTPTESTGRSPLDTLIVKHPDFESHIDWESPNNLALDPATFDMIWQDALACLSKKQRIYVTDRVIGADPAYALPVKTVTDRSITSLFTVNMFRPVPENINDSVFAKKPFTLVVLPYDKLNPQKYDGRLRKLPNGQTSGMAIVMDFEYRVGIVYGSAYCGSAKKLMFTVMNYYLPEEKILPLHCSANADENGEVALFLGLSGTGKTTLSAAPERALIGDDEHGWSANGIANFEYGCYAKLINLDPEKEPEIHHAVFCEKDVRAHGTIIENCMTYPDGRVDLFDDRLTPNSRASYPLSFLNNAKPAATADHPRTIIFLTADANGVLPPISRLDPAQAMLWFLMGYTSKLAGTETGIVTPVSTFSRFFGQPFMPKNPGHYSELLGKKMQEHHTRVFLINTGWSGGPYGEGRRINISVTRAMVRAAIEGRLDDMVYEDDPLFHLSVPRHCPGVPDEMLQPVHTWADPAAFKYRAKELAFEFSETFDKAYGNASIDAAVRAQCPGK